MVYGVMGLVYAGVVVLVVGIIDFVVGGVVVVTCNETILATE